MIKSALACLCAALVIVTAIGPARADERIIRIPMPGTDRGLVTRLCMTDDVPAPLVIINHGSPPKPEDRLTRTPSKCGEVSRFFTSRGYVVAFPLRRGYGETGGAWAETYGKCNSPDFVAGGLETADDIETALAYLSRQRFVAKGQTVIVGQSAGGWGTLAFASRNPQGVAAFINFAGGRGGHRDRKKNNNCAPDELVAAAVTFAKTTRQPSLWVYTRNDTFFPPPLSRRMYAAYTAAGGEARYELLGPFGKDGHSLFNGQGGSKIWGPIVERWLP